MTNIESRTIYYGYKQDKASEPDVLVRLLQMLNTHDIYFKDKEKTFWPLSSFDQDLIIKTLRRRIDESK